MYAPDMQEHIAVRYQALGYSVIPLDPGDKRPHAGLLPGRQWAPYQAAPVTRAVVETWAQMHPEPNWGLVCGQVSHGLYCGDCDDADYAHWVLAHAPRSVDARGVHRALGLRQGAHLVHLPRLESHVWRPRRGQGGRRAR